MKNKLFIIPLIILLSCKSAFNNENKAQRVILYHIGVIENYVKVGYIDDDSSLIRSVKFLEKLTNIKSDFTDQLAMSCEPSRKNIKDWKVWYKQNKDKLYWDEKEEEVKLGNGTD